MKNLQKKQQIWNPNLTKRNKKKKKKRFLEPSNCSEKKLKKETGKDLTTLQMKSVLFNLADVFENAEKRSCWIF